MAAIQPEDPAPDRHSEHAPALTPVSESAAGSAPASIVERTEVLEREVRSLLADARPGVVRGLTRQERRQAMHAVNTIAGGVKLLTTRLVGAEAASGDWAADGDKTLESWLGHHTGTGYGPAKSDVDMATTLEDLPALGQALEDGEVTVEHVRVTSRKYSRGSDAQKEALSSAEGQADLVHKAGRADAGAFGKQLDQDLARIDAAKLERDRDAVRRRRFVKLSDRNGGVQIDGFVDPVAGEHLRAALDAATPRPSAEDTRTPGNRRADALTAIARHALDSGDYKTGGNVRPHVMATLSASEWADWQRSGKAPTRAPGATIGDNIPLAPSEIDTLLCDCTLMRAVLDPDGQPVDLGRNKRTFTAYQRKALLLRDRHCTWPGCTMPGTYTEDHHVDEWAADNGTTSIDNGVLVCSFHHHYIHSHDITISPIQGGFQFTHPDGRLIGEHLFTRHDPPPAWAVGDDTQPHGDTYTHADKTTHADEDPTGRPPDPPPQLPLE